MSIIVDNRLFELSKDIPIEKLGLSNRAYNSLERAGIVSVGELLKYTFN